MFSKEIGMRGDAAVCSWIFVIHSSSLYRKWGEVGGMDIFDEVRRLRGNWLI